MPVLNRCAETGCPYLGRGVWCPTHRRSTTPDRMPSRQELLDQAGADEDPTPNTDLLRDRAEDYVFRLQLIDETPYFSPAQRAALRQRETESSPPLAAT